MTVDLDYEALARQFLSEGLEILASMEEAAMQLEDRPGDSELVHTIFRGMHTLKGNASCLDLSGLTHVAHVLEDVLEHLVDQSVAADSEAVTMLLRVIDFLRTVLPEAARGNDIAASLGDEIVLPLQLWCRRQLDGTVVRQDAFAPPTSRGGERQRSTTGAVRIDVEKLDALVNLTGELAIARGRLGTLMQKPDEAEAAAESFEESERLSQQLQELVTRMRMVAVGLVLRPFVRSVRDLAAKHGKKARLVISGADVEVDLSVVEHLRDPLMHMIRNSVDHGIETPETRVAKGKPAEGLITISARPDGGSIIIEVADDGVGLDRNRIQQKARSLGVTTELDRLSDQEIYRLILQPGFSTATAITELSGRGRRRRAEKRGGVARLDRHRQQKRNGLHSSTAAHVGDHRRLRRGVEEATYIVPLDSWSVRSASRRRAAGGVRRGPDARARRAACR
jgi:two-component system chemotaxis sensor kinase CheA